MDALRQRLRDSGAAFAAVFRNPNLRRLQLAGAGGTIGTWAYAVAVSVFAFHADGASGVGLLWLIRSLPAAAASPFAAFFADRFPRTRVMVASEVTAALLMGAAAGVIWGGLSPWIVYILAAVRTVIGMAFTPAEAALMPLLARTPSELTAANVVRATIDSTGFFVGPAIAGILLGVASIPTVFVLTAALTLWSAFFITLIRTGEQAEAEHAPLDETAEMSGLVAELGAGFRAAATERRLRILLALFSLQTLLTGALEVLVVVVAIDLLDLGNSGVGYLNSAIGVGGVFAAVVAAALLVGVRRLSVPFVVGAAVWAGPLIAVAAFVNPAFAIVMFGFVGLGATVTDVTAHTLLQRAVPNAILGRVYGVMAMFWLVAIGVGAVVTPAIIRALGKRWTLVAAGLFMQVLLLAFGPRLVRIDAAATAPAAERLDILRAINIFAPLSGLVLEQLAQQLIDVEEPAGTTVIVEGDPGDRFYIIAGGEVDVTKDEVRVARLGPGDYFGEIALLRDVPRTATCTAATDVRLFALEREDFLAAVTGHPGSVQAAEGIVTSRLAGLQTATTAGVMARPARL